MNEPKFETIREFAKRGILSENYIRRMQKRGQLPGLYVGNRYLINVERFLEQLDSMSLKNAGRDD